jgi:hypothetical protein
MKNVLVNVPFTGLVHFEGTNFTQTYQGTYFGVYAFDYYVDVSDVTPPYLLIQKN